MTFLLANWKLILLSVMTGLIVMFFTLWRHEVNAFDEYRIKVIAEGEVADAHAKEVEALHVKTLEAVNANWNDQLPKVRDGAVAAYLRAHPPGGVLPRPYSGPMSVNAVSPQSIDETRQECVPPDGFIQDCAEDSLKIKKWQDWATENNLKVE